LLKRDHNLYFPIDMDEDFTSVLKCSLDANELFHIQFGMIDKEGVGIDIISFDSIGEIDKAFTGQTAKVECEKEDLEIAIAENLLLLNQESMRFIPSSNLN